MCQVEGIERVKRAIRQIATRHLSSPSAVRGESVVVGYTAAYALYVHENIEMKWRGRPRRKPHKGAYWDPPGRGQAKFLEQPARELNNSGELSRVIVKAMRSREVTLQEANYLAAMRIQRESQRVVPVDTGNLKQSAFTKKE